VQGDAYSLPRLLASLLIQPAAAMVSGLPLVTKPIRQRLHLIRDAFDLMLPGAPFVQFTYSMAAPLPQRLGGFSVEASERIWMNLPPARVWVYRRAEGRNRKSEILKQKLEIGNRILCLDVEIANLSGCSVPTSDF